MSTNLTRHALFLQVYNSLAQRIASGGWTPGQALPNEIDLARDFGVSAGTIRKALDLLQDHRLIERHQGRGTFVLDHSTDDLAFRFVNLIDANGERIVSRQTTLLSQALADATEAERDRLQIARGQKVLRTRRVRHHNDRPFSYEEASLAVGRLPGLRHNAIAAADYRIVPFAQKHGIRLRRGGERVTHLPASSDVARLLDVERGTQLLKLDRVVCSLAGQPIEWRIALCNLAGGYYVAVMN
jgi:GntR family transcriptional regulator